MRMKKKIFFVLLLAPLLLGAGCAAMTAEKYGSHQRVEFEFPPANTGVASASVPIILESGPAIQEGLVKEGITKFNLCESRARRTPPNSKVKYIAIGSDPVDTNRYYDPSREVLFYLLKDMFLIVEGKKGSVRGWIEEGTVIVADRATYRALRVCKCGNGIKDIFYFDAVRKGGG